MPAEREAARALLEKRLRVVLEPLCGESNDDERRKQARDVIEKFLRAEPRPPCSVIEDPERPGVFLVSFAPGDHVIREDVIVVSAPSDAQVEYLDDIAALFLAAPEDSVEEDMLEEAHLAACIRLGVDAERHLAQACALGKVELDAADGRPVVLRIAEAFTAALEDKPEEWLNCRPWERANVPAREWIAAQAMHAVGEAYAVVGEWPNEQWAEVLAEALTTVTIADVMGCFGWRAGAVDVTVLRRRAEIAIAIVLEVGP